MLNGIEVLNKVELTDKITPISYVIALIGFLMVFIISLIISLACYFKRVNHTKWVILVILFGLITWFISLTPENLYTQKVPNGECQYQVTISDNVSMVEFNERYEVIDIDGKILTIVEKDGK